MTTDTCASERRVHYTLEAGTYRLEFFDGAHRHEMEVQIEHAGRLEIKLRDGELADVKQQGDTHT